MRPEGRVWRKEARRDRRGRRRQPGTNSPNSARLIRRIQRFHEARLLGIEIDEAAVQLNVSLMEAWRYEDFINALIDDLRDGA